MTYEIQLATTAHSTKQIYPSMTSPEDSVGRKARIRFVRGQNYEYKKGVRAPGNAA